MDYVGSMPRPSPRTMGKMVRDDMMAALDVQPQSHPVRTWADVLRESYRTEQAERAAAACPRTSGKTVLRLPVSLTTVSFCVGGRRDITTNR